jgi:cytochrome c oxidase subunit 2
MTTVQLTNGSYARVDNAFLRDSILNPTMHTTAGYAPIMPTYQGQISEEGLIDLVEYIKQLNSNYRIQQTLNTSQVQSPVQTSTSTPAQHTAATAPGMVEP